MRSYVPEWQVAFLKTGLVSEVQTAVTRNGSDTIYEIFFPKRQLVPIEMQVEKPKRVPCTKYSAELHWDLIEQVTELPVDRSSLQDNVGEIPQRA